MFDNISTFIFIILLCILLYFVFLYISKFLYFRKKYILLFKNTKNNLVAFILLAISGLIIFLGIFGFSWGEKKVQNELNGLDVVFVLDVSKSMNALFYNDDNYYYSGLDTAKTLISNFVANHLQDRFGLVIFAGDAISSVPLTTDHSTFLTFLDNVDYRNLNKQGTNIEKAIKLGVDRLDYSEDRAKVMIVLSDGGDADVEIDYDLVESYIKDKNITSIVVGTGNKKGGKIPVKSFGRGNITYQKYKGEDVVIQINIDSLKKLAKSLEGEYLSTDNLDDIDNNLDKLEKNVLKAGDITEKLSANRYIALIAFIFFVLYFIFSFINIGKNEG